MAAVVEPVETTINSHFDKLNDHIGDNKWQKLS